MERLSELTQCKQHRDVSHDFVRDTGDQGADYQGDEEGYVPLHPPVLARTWQHVHGGLGVSNSGAGCGVGCMTGLSLFRD